MKTLNEHLPLILDKTQYWFKQRPLGGSSFFRQEVTRHNIRHKRCSALHDSKTSFSSDAATCLVLWAMQDYRMMQGKVVGYCYHFGVLFPRSRNYWRGSLLSCKFGPFVDFNLKMRISHLQPSGHEPCYLQASDKQSQDSIKWGRR